MRMIKFLGCMGALVAVCVWSYDYTKGHESTLQKQKIAEYKSELHEVSGQHNDLIDEHNHLEWKLRQACDLLTVAKIKNDVCEEPEPEESEKETENSDE